MKKSISFLFALFLFLSCGTQKIANYKTHSVTIDGSADTSNLESLIAPYRTAMEEEMEVVIGSASITLEGKAPESTLGNFASEAVYNAGLAYGRASKEIGTEAMEKSFSLINFGGLRSVINKGDITIGNIYELMPFDNTLTLVKLSGEDVRRCAQYLFAQHGQPVYNAKFTLSSNSEFMTIGDKPYNFDEEVVIITSDYLASGGDKMEFFKDPIQKWDSGIFIRDVFIDYVKEMKDLGRYDIEDKFHFVKN